MHADPKVLVIGAGQVGIGTLDALLDKGSIHHDVDLVGIMTRRPEQVKRQFSKEKGVHPHVFVYEQISDLQRFQGSFDVDVAVICNASQSLWYHSEDGSIANEDGPKFAEIFPVTVDSFDNHGEIADYASAMASVHGTEGLACIGFGWDPGDFTLHKNVQNTVFPRSVTNFFYGPGVSQGHTTAIKTDPKLKQMGVEDAVQFTMPREEAMEDARSGERVALTASQRMWRDVYVLLREGADEATIRKYIQTMKDYFADYETRVTAVSREKMSELQQRKGHQGVVITTGTTKKGNNIVLERRVSFESNAEATGCFLAAATVAGYKAYQKGKRGAVGPGDLARNLYSYLPTQGIWETGL